MKRIVHYKPAEARDFFERLATYSAAYVQRATPGIGWPSPNHHQRWRNDDGPIGHILHHTAGVKFAGTLRHFIQGRHVSSNWVVARGIDDRFDELRKDLELDSVLRADTVQVVPPEFPAWHAGWANRICLGTEARNAGILRPYRKGKNPAHMQVMDQNEYFNLPTRRRGEKVLADMAVEDLDFYWWAESWTSPFRGKVQRVETERGVSFWEPYSRGQLATIIGILRYAACLYPLDRTWMLAHHQTKPTKSDVVLPLDLNALHDAVFYSDAHVDDIEWLADLEDDETGFSDDDDPGLRMELDDIQNDRGEEDEENYDPLALDTKVSNSMEAIEALARLKYHVVDDASLAKSAWIYQRSRGLKPTGKVDSGTMRALTQDIRKWRLADLDEKIA